MSRRSHKRIIFRQIGTYSGWDRHRRKKGLCSKGGEEQVSVEDLTVDPWNPLKQKPNNYNYLVVKVVDVGHIRFERYNFFLNKK